MLAGVGGSESDIVIQSERLARLKRDMAEITARHTGQPVERIVADFDRDRWFTAEQARDYGLVDQVIKSAREAADDGRPARQKD